MFKTAVLAVFCGAVAFPAVSRAAAFYLYYNINSPHLDEIGVDGSEVAKVFDDEFGPASEELPSEVKITDFFVAKYPNQSYVFMLNAPFNCGQLGCNTRVYRRDADGDLMLEESYFPVKCKYYEFWTSSFASRADIRLRNPNRRRKKARFIILHRGEAIKTKISGSRI
ncbi:MAG: hypothetical protein ACLU99_05015 [Alphaproteobacteria bacterium]